MRPQKKEVWKLNRKKRNVKRCVYHRKNKLMDNLKGKSISMSANKNFIWKEATKEERWRVAAE